MTRRLKILGSVVLICAIPLTHPTHVLAQGANNSAAAQNRPPALAVASTSFSDGGVIPEKYTGLNPSPVSPALSWTNVPPGTISFALLMHDPDTAPNKSTSDVLHWLAFNIPGSSRSLSEGVPNVAQLPDGTVQVQNRNSFGFAGPGAPPGPYHHYTIEIFALDTALSLGPTASRDDVLKAIDGHVLSRGVYIGRFHR